MSTEGTTLFSTATRVDAVPAHHSSVLRRTWPSGVTFLGRLRSQRQAPLLQACKPESRHYQRLTRRTGNTTPKTSAKSIPRTESGTSLSSYSNASIQKRERDTFTPSPKSSRMRLQRPSTIRAFLGSFLRQGEFPEVCILDSNPERPSRKEETVQTHVEIIEVPADQRETVRGDRRLLRGRSLASLLEELGGFSGEVTLWTGETVPISLEKWHACDPESTFLSVQVVSDKAELSPLRFSPARPHAEGS